MQPIFLIKKTSSIVLKLVL